MLKTRVIKTAYTGLSLIDIGFSSRILKKYGLFSDNYLTGLSMIFRQDKARGRTGGTAVYRNIFNRTLVFRFHNSHSLDNYIPKLIPLTGQIEESGSVNRDPIGPDFKYITAWYLNLQRYIKPKTAISQVVYQKYPSAGKNRMRLARNGAGSDTYFRRGEERGVGRWAGDEESRIESVIPSATEPKQVQYITRTEASSMFSRSSGRFDIGRLNYARQQKKSEIFNIIRDLHAEFMNYRTEKHSVDYDITSIENSHKVSGRFAKNPDNLNPGYLKGYGPGKQLAGYQSWLEWYQRSSWKRIQRAEVELAFERQVLENHRQKLTNTLRRLSLEISKNKTGQQIQESDQRLTNRVGSNPGRFYYTQGRLGEKTRLKQELQRIRDIQSIREKSVTGDTQIPGGILRSPSDLGVSGNDRILEEAGITDTIQLPGNIRGPRNTRRVRRTVRLSKPGPAPDNGMLESEWNRINRGHLNLTEPGSGTDMVFSKNVRYNRLLDEQRFRETAIMRKEQQLSKVLEIQHYMDLQWRRFESENILSFKMKRFLTTQNSQNVFDRHDDQQMKDAYLTNRNFDRLSKTLMFSESLIKLNELIRYEYRQQPKMELHTNNLKKTGTFALIDKKTISKTELYNLQTRTMGDLGIAGPYPNESHTSGPQHRKMSMPSRFIAEVIERGQVIQSYQEKKRALYQKEIQSQDEIWQEIASAGVPVPQHRKLRIPSRFIAEVIERGQIIQSYQEKKRALYQKEIQSQDEIRQEIEPGGAGYSRKQPEFKQISKGKPRFRLYTKQPVRAEEEERKKTRYLKQDNILNYEYNSRRFRHPSTNLSREMWDRVRYNTKVINQWNNSEPSTLKILKNGTMKKRSSIEQNQKTLQLDNNIRSTLQVPINIKELGINQDIITKSNIHLYQIKGSKLKISQKGSELKRLHRIVPGINAAISMPENFSKYSPMDFHRQMKEPDFESNAAKARNEEIVNDPVYQYEGEIKIDQANMERIVNNVYNEIERRLEFERQRRGL
ncbi:MAG: hypothetical protein ABFD18_05225 [Syntrophomonas sp.]